MPSAERRVPLPAARRRRRSLLVPLVLLLALLAASCASGGDSGNGAAGASGTSGGGEGGGVLRIAMSAGNVPFPSTPPNEGYEGYRFVGNNIYDALTRFDLDQAETIPTAQPSLAESWEVSEDQLTWTFHLREGVTFHDGTPFDAEAAVFQFDRINDPDFEHYDAINAPRYGNYMRFVESWEAVDPQTFTVTTSEPYAWLAEDLAHVFFPSPTVVQEVGNDAYNQHATGTGPFVMTRYVDGEVMELTANEDYWGGRPLLDQIVLYPKPEPAARLSALQSGEVDWAEVPAPDAIEQLEAEGFAVHLGKYPHGIMPRFNMFREPFADNLALRQALNYALDREGIAALINDVGYPASQFVYEGHPDFVDDHPGYSYDPERARELLAEAGYEPGELELTMAYPTGGSGNMFPGPMMEKLQADFEAIGVGVELMPLEWNTIITILYEGMDQPAWSDIDIMFISPAAGQVSSGYGSAFLCERPGGLPNATGNCTPGVDEAYAAAMASFDPEESHAHLRDMMRLALDDAMFLYWVHDLNLRVMSPEVQGYVHAQSWWTDFTIISMEG
ncbi:ABC transporter substrate-binding protein [Actinomarinicola tropica]|uniref:ABC transporter substrate-binding protein n=1 Tax=Actinomarinicola tropica TaxID=2789776 RepID=A0A5Q2RJC7_9ACTN|nr:ABC transporter substrate-binding protein [Actinomarinicola tropica]QGG94992.1 ABC transporter substrate-binding protein [Actinomarinicola tropica]